MHETAHVTDLAGRLRSATRTLHARAERSGIMPALLRGELDRATYCRLLRNLHVIYAALETALARHARHPLLAPIADPRLARATALAADLVVLHGPDWMQDLRVAAGASDYARRIATLAAADPPLLAAHAYVRYLGDLSGGQMLRDIVRKALRLDADDGIAFYRFSDDAGLLARRFRSGLDAIPADAATTARIVAEARDAFERHVRLFDELAEPQPADPLR